MSKPTENRGINYAGLEPVNIDRESGIRYGVIPQGAVLQSWADSSEADYGSPTDIECPECGTFIDVDEWGDEGTCPKCEHTFEVELPDFAEPLGFTYTEDGYAAQCGEDGDIFICKSPYFTYAQFCSPCAPGACHLENPLKEPHLENKCYCFGHNWFEDGIAPYPVYRVEDGARIIAERKVVPCYRCQGTGIVTTADLAEKQGITRAKLERNLTDVVVTNHTIKCWVCHGTKTVERVIEHPAEH